MRASQPLDALAWAIVSAFAWSGEHYYTFILSDAIDDGVFRQQFQGNPRIAKTPDEGPLSMPVGALGMTPGHRFSMRYDLLAKHEFGVKLVAVKPKSDARAKYPRVTAKSGKAPASRR